MGKKKKAAVSPAQVQLRRRRLSHQKQQVFRSGQTKSLERFESKIVGRTLSLSRRREKKQVKLKPERQDVKERRAKHTTLPHPSLSPPGQEMPPEIQTAAPPPRPQSAAGLVETRAGASFATGGRWRRVGAPYLDCVRA